MQTPNCSWLPPPTNLTLADDEVHVWLAPLDLPSSHVQLLRGILTADELGRADRFHFAQAQRHFIAGRGILRTILGRYLTVAPEHIRFCYNRYGKPFLTSDLDHHKLNFNLSHSDGLALYAITRMREIGIDLERIRTNFAYEQIAEQFFSAGEVAILRTVPATMKPKAFFNCWTRKEAYIKARGQGLALPLDSFEVSLVPGEPARLLAVRGGLQKGSHWTLQELRPGYGYVGALAVKGCNCRPKFWQWPNKIAG